MRKIVALLLVLWSGPAWAQCTGLFPPNTLCGNSTGSPAPPGPFTASTIAGPGSSTIGDIAVWNNTGGSLLKDTPPLQIYGTIGNNLFLSGPSTGGPLNPTFRAITAADLAAALAAISGPTHQTFLSGSGTYTTPANTQWIEINLVGAGGGGSGGASGANAGGAGGTGGNTCWNTSGPACTSPVYQAGGGAGGGNTNSFTQAAGGTISGSGTCDWGVPGGGGASNSVIGNFTNASNMGATGGGSSLAGGGVGGIGSATVGVAGPTNSGAGGGGGGSNNGGSNAGGNAGAAGATCHVVIRTPAGTYTYAVGAAGTAGAAGTGGTASAGGAGALGLIVVYEHYAP